jgi:hypothetical protein
MIAVRSGDLPVLCVLVASFLKQRFLIVLSFL